MKIAKELFSSCCAICLCGVYSISLATQAQAETAATATGPVATVSLEDVKRLEKEIRVLQEQLSLLKQQATSYASKAEVAQVAAEAKQNQRSVQKLAAANKAHYKAAAKAQQQAAGLAGQQATSGFIIKGSKLIDTDDSALIQATMKRHDYHGAAVATSPTLGSARSAEDGSDLITCMPTINDDLAILKYRKRINDYLVKNHVAVPERPVIALSGAVETEFDYNKEYDGGSNSNIDLSTAKLNVLAEVNPWVTTMLILDYDSSSPKDAPRINNSRLRIDKGYITIGNLNHSPFYFSIGQMYAPFGTYSSYRINNSPIKVLGRAKDRMAVVGFNSNAGLEAQLFALSNELHYKHGSNIADHLGANLAYRHNFQDGHWYVGASYIGALAESRGLLLNAFKVAKSSAEVGSTTLHKKVRGLNLRGRVNYKDITLLGEYVTALGRFDVQDLSFNGRGALPRALELGAAYNFKLFGRPSSLGLGWGRSWEALAIALPRHSYYLSYNMFLFKNTLLGFEWKHDINYPVGSTAKGSNTLPAKEITKAGSRHRDTYSVKLGVYF